MMTDVIRNMPISDQSGVYQILNTITGKRYIGSSVRIRRRCKQHVDDLNRQRHRNSLLQRAWNKYGPGSFTFAVCELCVKEHCVGVEQVMIDYYKAACRQHGYNLSPTARSVLGVKHSEEVKKANSERAKLRMQDPSVRQALAIANKGKKQSAESIAKTVAANTGKKRSDECRARMAISATGRKMSAEAIEKHAAALRGRKQTDEHRAKNSAANTGKKMSPEAVEKAAAARRGKPRSAETRAKLSAANKGKTASEETRKKLSDVHRGKKKSPESIAKRAATMAAKRAARCP